MTNGSPLARRLGLGDAIVIGLGSMIGAGVFAVFAPAAAAAGSGLLIGLAIAAAVAYGNATSSAQLAAQYPTSGGSYIYGRERLGEWPGFLAGWSFVIGKTASCAVMAITFAAYAVPLPWQKPVAVAAVLTLAIVNSYGVTRTAALTRIIVVIVLAVLTLVIVIGFLPARGSTPATSTGELLAAELFAHGPVGILQSAGLLFFAFAGYARIATMGEEVKNPTRTLPRAITTALVIVLVLYVLVALAALTVTGPERLAAAEAPLVMLVEDSGIDWASPLVRIGAALASLGALLALIAGVGRTSLAMARHGDLPAWMATVHPRHQAPYQAELALALVVGGIILLTDLRGAIGFSSFGVLLYYAIANLSALTQDAAHRRYPRALQLVGLVGCLVLTATLPLPSVLVGLGVLAVGVVYRLVRLRLRRSSR